MTTTQMRKWSACHQPPQGLWLRADTTDRARDMWDQRVQNWGKGGFHQASGTLQHDKDGLTTVPAPTSSLATHTGSQQTCEVPMEKSRVVVATVEVRVVTEVMGGH